MTRAGLARRTDWEGFPDEIGGDWMLVGEMALKGRVTTLRDVRLHRSASGISADGERFAREWGLTGFAARHHHLVVAAHVVRRFGTRAPLASSTTAVRLPACAAASLSSSRSMASGSGGTGPSWSDPVTNATSGRHRCTQPGAASSSAVSNVMRTRRPS